MVNRDGSGRRGGREKEREDHGRRLELEEGVFTGRVCID